MIDKAYSVYLLPTDFEKMTYEDANAIEDNLLFLVQLLPYFVGVAKDGIGSYGYLQLTETGTAGEAFSVQESGWIDNLTITIQGEGLPSLTVQGAGWVEKSRATDKVIMYYVSPSYMNPSEILSSLSQLQFHSTDDVTAHVTLQAGNTIRGPCAPTGPAPLIFRDAAPWMLLEGLALTWGALAGYTWNEVGNMRKPQ